MRKQITLILITCFLGVSCNDVKEVYYPSGKLHKEFTFKDGLANGPFKVFYESGKIKREGVLKDNKFDGESIWYYENGEIEIKELYSKGISIGKVEEYYPSGILKFEYFNNQSGKIEGSFILYYPDGKLKKEVEFKNGEENGRYKSFHPNGQLSLDAVKKNDSTTTYYKSYDENGILEEEFRYVIIEPLIIEPYFVGDEFKARIAISGPIEGEKLSIMTNVFGVDKKSRTFNDSSEISYTSLPLIKAGKRVLLVNFRVDTASYSRQFPFEVVERPVQ